VQRGAAAVAVVDVGGAAHATGLEAVRWLRAAAPRVAVVACCGSTPPPGAAFFELVRVGVAELVVGDDGDSRTALRAAIADAFHAVAANDVLSDIRPLLPRTVFPIVLYCLEHGSRTLTPLSVARALGVHRETLSYRLSVAGFPPPNATICWCRLLLAARYHEEPDAVTEQIALALDFPSGTALRNMMWRYAGLRMSDVRAAGGRSQVTAQFRAALTRGSRALYSADGNPPGQREAR
jgi:hypothetical protein